MITRLAKQTSAFVLAAGLAAVPASAATILTFGQTSPNRTVTATANAGQTQTVIAASDVAIMISQIMGGGTPSAFFTFTATSTGAATPSVLPGYVQQMYGGSFSITSGTGGSGTNYLSGTFDGVTFGTGVGGALSSSTPAYNVNFTSSVIPTLGLDRAISLAFTDIAPNLNICGTTLCSFQASVGGNFSASVPEPASWAMMVVGFGLLGATMRRRRPTVSAVTFG